MQGLDVSNCAILSKIDLLAVTQTWGIRKQKACTLKYKINGTFETISTAPASTFVPVEQGEMTLNLLWKWHSFPFQHIHLFFFSFDSFYGSSYRLNKNWIEIGARFILLSFQSGHIRTRIMNISSAHPGPNSSPFRNSICRIGFTKWGINVAPCGGA